MNNEIAVYLLRSLLDRLARDQLGTVSGAEREALEYAKNALGGNAHAETKVQAAPSPASPKSAFVVASVSDSNPYATDGQDGSNKWHPEPKRAVELDLTSLDRGESDNPDVMLCLDFGTAMSKAFALTKREEALGLALGIEAGYQGYPLPSTVFISDEGLVYFGHEALTHSQDVAESQRSRFDSLKGVLSLRSRGDLDSEVCVLRPDVNPTSIRLTEGALIRFFLAYLTDLALRQLAAFTVGNEETIGRYVKRRFAHPCWAEAGQKQWAEPLMRKLLAEAQVLADTFSGRWEGGIDIREVAAAVEQVRRLPSRPDYIIEGGVPEPVAVAASALADGSTKRDPFMVVDVGAGTTDFGIFVIREDEDTELHKVFQLPNSIAMIKQAGDKVDNLLLFHIVEHEKIDRDDAQGRLVIAQLRREIRGFKERLFVDGILEYVLEDSTTGIIDRSEFLASPSMKGFTETVLKGFKDALECLDDSWLAWIAKTGLKVVLTGGGASLPMMKALGSGMIVVRGHKIVREAVDPTPTWLKETVPDLVPVYPQMAVAVGGAALELPEVVFGPEVFGGGNGRTAYVADRMQVAGT